MSNNSKGQVHTCSDVYQEAVKAVESAVDMLGFNPVTLADGLDKVLRSPFERYLMRMVAKEYLEMTEDKEY